MTKQHLLLVDGDSRSLRALEASLRGAGFAVSTAMNGDDALARCRVSAPDLVVSDTEMPGIDGFELCRTLKADDRLRDTAFIFLTGRGSVEEKVRGLELGVEDYLTKPIDIRELVTRVRLAVEKKEKERLLRRERRASISGALADLPLADLVQTLEVGRKSGTVRLEERDGRSGTIWLRDGRIVDAAAGRLRGEGAMYRLLRWREGRFAIDFGRVDGPVRITAPTQHLLLEGMRRLDEWTRTLERLPPLRAVLQIDYLALSDRLAEIPDDLNGILKLVDGRRPLGQVIDEAEHDDLATVSALEVLVREGILQVRTVLPEPREGSGAVPTPVAAAPSSSDPRTTVDSTAPQPFPAADVDWFAGPSSPAPVPAVPPVLAPIRDPMPPVDPDREPTARVTAAPPSADAEPPPPRIVRFAAKARATPQQPPASAEPVSPAPEPAPPVAAPDFSPRRTWPTPVTIAAIAAALLILGLATWAVTSARSAGGEAASAPAAPAATAGYEASFAEARREHAAAHLAKAIAHYRVALGFRETAAALEGLGRALHESGQGAAAIEALRRAIEVDPSSAAPYMALARVYQEARRMDEATAAYQRYLALEPQGSHADEARAAIAASAH